MGAVCGRRCVCVYACAGPLAGAAASGAALKNLSQLHAGLVQLRFRRADGAAEYLRDLLVLVAFNVVEYEGGAVARRQLREGRVERYTVHQLRRLRRARLARLEELRSVAFERVLPARLAFTETHQDLRSEERRVGKGW